MMKINKTVFIYTVLGISLFGLIITSPPIQIAKWMVLSFLAPDIEENITKKWEKKSNTYLLRKMQNYDFMYSGIAAEILAKRKEPRAFPILMKNTHSLFWLKRKTAIQVLGDLGDKRAIKPLLKIVDRGPKNADYETSLNALSKLGCDSVYPLVLNMLNKKHGDGTLAIDMLGNFAKPESLPILQRIYESDPKDYIREDALQAIEKIREQLNSIKNIVK